MRYVHAILIYNTHTHIHTHIYIYIYYTHIFYIVHTVHIQMLHIVTYCTSWCITIRFWKQKWDGPMDRRWLQVTAPERPVSPGLRGTIVVESKPGSPAQKDDGWNDEMILTCLKFVFVLFSLHLFLDSIRSCECIQYLTDAAVCCTKGRTDEHMTQAHYGSLDKVR